MKMSFIRIRLTFQHPLPLKEVKNCWFLLDTSTCSTIADLEYLIKKRFISLSKSCTTVDLFLEDYLLPSQEKIEIIQNNDNIRVEVKEMIIKPVSREEGYDDQEKVQRSKQDKHLPDASNKAKRKQADDSEGALNERKKNRSKPPENGIQDVKNTERYNKAKKEKHSYKDRKNLVKEPKVAKKVHRKHKPNLPTQTVTTSNNVSSLAQVERKYTKALALTSTLNTQVSKSSRPSKEKSNMEDKSNHPSQRFSSKANIGKRKSNLEPMKTNSKKTKTNTISKAKDLVSGKKTLNGIVIGNRAAVENDTSSSQSSTESSSSSSTESSSATRNNVSSLAQVRRKSTKALALTTTLNTQLSKSSRPSKEKSNMEDKSNNPSQRFSSKANIGKRKLSNLEPMKTNSKKSKTSANSKGKDLVSGKTTLNGIVTGNRTSVDNKNSSSQSSTESSSSSSESTDESGPSNSRSKVNGTVSQVASAELINNDKSPLHERFEKDAEHKIAKDSSVRKTGKYETGVPSKSHTNSKGNGTLRESSSSAESSTDTDKPADVVRKNTRSSSSSSSSSESEKEKAKLNNNNKETSSSLLHPLLSSPSSQSFPSPSLLRGIQMQNTNETSVNQSPIHSITEKFSLSGQKQAQQSTIRRQNKKPDSGNSTSHIRFDSEESDEETVVEQQDVYSMKDIADDPNNSAPSSKISADEQNHQASLERAASECKEGVQRDYSLCTPLHGPPRNRDRIAYKVLELSVSYTPEVSSYKEGTVVNFDSSSGAITIELSKESLKRARGDGNITGKFELVYDESEENTDNREEDTQVVVPWNSMIDPVLIE